MTKDELEERRALVKKMLLACNGHVGHAADCLGMSRNALSHMLNHKGMIEWYVPYRNKLTLERTRARSRRAYKNRRRRQLIEQGLDPDLYESRKPQYV